MARIMVYKEAMQRLDCVGSLTPNNRGICKKTALDYNALEAPLAGFDPNRLVPASVVAKKYYVVFLNEGGTPIGSGYYEPGAALNDPGIPPKAGHTGAWNNGYTGYATGDVTYSPVYTPINYTITFNNWDGSLLETKSAAYGTIPTYTGSTPTRSGYSWTGHWSPNDPVAATGNATYTATFTLNQSTVTYIVYNTDGTVAQQYTETVTNGNTPSNYPSTPSPVTNYTGAWNPSNPASTIINGDVTFTYSWTYTGPSTAGPFCIQGGASENTMSEDDPYMTKNFQIGNPPQVGTTPIDFTLNITGWIYNNGTFTEISAADNATITVQHYVHVPSQSGHDLTGTTLTMSQNLYDLGFRWYRDTVEDGVPFCVSGLSKTYHYLQAAHHASLWCPSHDRNWLFTFYASSSDLPSGRYLYATGGYEKSYAELPGGPINTITADSRAAVETSDEMFVY